MTNHDIFLDAMYGIDEKFMSVHIRKKCPAAVDKAKRYLVAVAVYAAAILLVAGLIPFIIGQGNDPTPQPGSDPVIYGTDMEEGTLTPESDGITTFSSEIVSEGITTTTPPETTTITQETATVTTVTQAPVIQPSVPDVPVDSPETQAPEAVTTVPVENSLYEEFGEIRKRLASYGEVAENGLRLIVGVNSVVEYGDDDFVIELVVGNESSQTMRLYDPEGERYPLECLDLSFGGESVSVGPSLDLDPICMLPPGKKITFTRHISVQSFEHMTDVDWNAEWTLASNISYLITGKEYHSSCSVKIPKTSKSSSAEITRYLNRMAEYNTTYFDGCRYIVGIDKSFYSKGDSITVTVILQNNGPNTLYFKNNYIREHFLDHVEFALGQGYFYEVFNREGSSEDWLEPGEFWAYTTTCDPESCIDMVNWYNDWEVTAQVEYTMDGTEYTRRVSVGVPHVNVFY